MIKTQLSRRQIYARINANIIEDKIPLKTHLGFSNSSHERKTFSIILSESELVAIQKAIDEVYKEVVEKFVTNKNSQLPFSMIRIDAFWNIEDKSLKILEINSWYIGMHEVAEYLDIACAKKLKSEYLFSLSTEYAINQRKMIESHISKYGVVNFIAKPFVPRWIYYDALKKVFSDKVFLENYEDLEYRGELIKAIITKFPEFKPEMLQKVNILDQAEQLVKIPETKSRGIGFQSNLPLLSAKSVNKSTALSNFPKNQLINGQSNYVLKHKMSSSSKKVYLGVEYSKNEWGDLVNMGFEDSGSYIVQEYVSPPVIEIIQHSNVPIQKYPYQLGIFVLPIDYERYNLDFSVKAYTGPMKVFKFDPSETMEDILFGNVIVMQNTSINWIERIFPGIFS